MDDMIYLEPNNIIDIVDIMSSHFDKINEFAGFNINKRIHPSYSKQITTLIPSLKPISLSSSKDQKPFPKKLNENNLIPLEPIKSNIMLPKSPKSNVTLPKSPKSNIILPKSPKSSIILPESPKRNIMLPRSPKSNIMLPRSSRSNVSLPESPRNNISKLQTITVTDLKPNIPKIENVNNKIYKDLGSQLEIKRTFDKIELPQLATIIDSKKLRPVIAKTQNSNIPEVPDMDDEHRKILLNTDFNKLSKTRHGKNNETYDLPTTKELAKRIKVSSKGNKDEIIERIQERALQLGINIT